MNKNFLFLLLIILIIGIIVFLYSYKDINQKIKEFFEENTPYSFLYKFILNTKDYTLNIIIPEDPTHTYDNTNTNYFEIKDLDLDGKQINNTIFTKFLSARTILNDELTEKYENFVISNNVIIQFDKIDKFLEIEFNFRDTTKFLKLTINSASPTSEIINIERNIDNSKKSFNMTNTDKNIIGIEFCNKTMKQYDYKNNKYNIFNLFYINLRYLNSKSEIIPDMITKLDDGLENHFCENLLSVSVYSNPLKKITINNKFSAEIYIEKDEPIIKSKRTDNFDIVAYTHNTGRIFKPKIEEKDIGKYGSLGAYMYDERKEGYKKVAAWKQALIGIGSFFLGLVTFGAGFLVALSALGLEAAAKKKNVIAYKNLRDALLLNIDNKYVIPAENVGYMWDDDFINLKGRGKNTNSDIPGTYSYEKRNDPLVLFNLLPVSKDGFVYYPIGNFAYTGPVNDINAFRKNKKPTKKNPNSNIYVFKNRMGGEIPHVLVREDCIDFTPMANHGPHMIWWDAGAPTPSSLDGSASSYWVKYINLNQSLIDKLNKENSDNGGYRNTDVNNPGDFLALFNGSHSTVSTFNYQIKKNVLEKQARQYDIATKTSTIIDKIKIAIQNITNITEAPIPKNTNVSPYFTQINKDKTDSQSNYIANINFNKKMENIQKDYDYNFSYITEINSQLSDIRQKEKIFVENQIKQQLENNKTNIQKDVKNQTQKLNKYDNDISQTSTTIKNQINEYVVLRKQRELMPLNPQVMY